MKPETEILDKLLQEPRFSELKGITAKTAVNGQEIKWTIARSQLVLLETIDLV